VIVDNSETGQISNMEQTNMFSNTMDNKRGSASKKSLKPSSKKEQASLNST